MLHKFFNLIDRFAHFEQAKAHCDVPCGIYDPHAAQVAALTVIRMVDLMQSLETSHPEKDLAYYNSLSRYITVKEEHAEKVKHEVRVIWGDFIKPEHHEKYPQLAKLVDQIMKQASKARQTVDREASLALLQSVNQFAEIFWQIKGVAVKTVKAPYAPAEEVTYPLW